MGQKQPRAHAYPWQAAHAYPGSLSYHLPYLLSIHPFTVGELGLAEMGAEVPFPPSLFRLPLTRRYVQPDLQKAGCALAVCHASSTTGESCGAFSRAQQLPAATA